MTALPEILVVDDDPVLRDLLGVALRAEFSIRFAATGDEAIAALVTDPPAAVLLDLDVPGVDGYGVLEVRRRRRLAAQTCVVMLSAVHNECSLVRSWVLGADAYLTKPIDPDHISARLRTLLATPRPSCAPATV